MVSALERWLQSPFPRPSHCQGVTVPACGPDKWESAQASSGGHVAHLLLLGTTYPSPINSAPAALFSSADTQYKLTWWGPESWFSHPLVLGDASWASQSSTWGAL